eukprot:14777163-Ditylum_brightwellii.AAC.1
MDGRVPRDTKKHPQGGGTRPPRTLLCPQGRSMSGDAKFSFVNFPPRTFLCLQGRSTSVHGINLAPELR